MFTAGFLAAGALFLVLVGAATVVVGVSAVAVGVAMGAAEGLEGWRRRRPLSPAEEEWCLRRPPSSPVAGCENKLIGQERSHGTKDTHT